MSNNNNNYRPPKGRMGPGGGPGRIIEKPKNFKQAVLKIAKYCQKYYTVILIAIIFAIGGTIISLIGPNKIKDLINIITNGLYSGIDANAVTKIGVLLVCLYTISSVFTYIQSYIMATVTQKVSKSLRNNISKKINNVPLKYLDTTTYGDILSRVTNDVDTIAQALNNSVASLVSAIVMLIGCLIMMFITNWIMAITAILSTIIGFLLMIIIMSKSQKYFIRRQNAIGALNGHIEEVYSNHIVIKLYNGDNQTKNEFRKINQEVRLANRRSQFLSGLMHPLMGFIGNFGYVAVCIVGATLVMKGNITIGVIVAFMIYVRLFSNPLSQIAQGMTNLQSAGAASERVFEFLEEQELQDESYKNQVLTNVVGDVEFKNVKFGYKTDEVIIKDFSAKIKAGHKVAIVGPTGAGKTTIVNLLMRFYETNSGQILIDGKDITSLTRENVHDLFGMVLQDTWLFSGTIKENLVYNKSGISDNKIKETCKICGIDHFIRSLPHGYDTLLDENSTISAGQKQLFTIARAMLQNSPMLILDEATSSVDTRTEILIQNAMDKLTKGRTSFVIAHRLSTIKNANLILVMKDGDIVEAGTHNQLLKQKGFYFDLYNSQFEKSE